MTAHWIIYGANGYTGELIAREAHRQGLKPVLAGRSASAVEKLAAELKLEFRVFSLDDAAAVKKGIEGCKLVLHCAGPFSATSKPMIEACLAEGVHYLDITGEISVFRFAHEQSHKANRADTVLIPGAGFDVVPSDCLAASLVDALPAATKLVLAFELGGGPSVGTAKTSVESLDQGGRVCRDGELTRVPLAWKTRKIQFAHAERLAVTIPWGDVYTAHVSTGIPDIEVFMSMSPSTIANMRRLKWIQPLLRLGPVQNFIKNQVEKRIKGPDEQSRKSTTSELWGEVTSADGRKVVATMSTPNGYDLTVSSSLGIVRHLLKSDVEGGFYTPSLLMGANYANSLPGVTTRFL